ncbi:hypothetical protein MKW92_010407 [Papaver armeniacum]|nr:hypothetical protein MKW92_010407 [Papaver armeniacum]
MHIQQVCHNISKDSFSQISGGFYCLYCLHETQPFKHPFRIYLSLGMYSHLGMELDQKVLKRISTESIQLLRNWPSRAEKTVDTGNIKHLTENKKLIGDVVERMAESWNPQKEVFYEQTGINKEFTGNEGENKSCFRVNLTSASIDSSDTCLVRSWPRRVELEILV